MSGLKRVLLAVAPWLPVVVVGAVAAYAEIFRRFANLDDEGMFLSSLRYFIDGKSLYNEVFSQYGPLYHLTFGAFFKVTGIEIGAETGRLIVIVVWLITATMFGVLVKRLTGSLVLGVTGQAVAFGSASLLSGEPMHPVGLVCLLLGATLLTLITVERTPIKSAAVLGVFIGLLMMIKINIGGLGAVAIVCAAALTVSPLRDDRRIRWAAIAILVLIPAILMAPDLHLGWVNKLAFTLAAAGGSAVLVLTPDAKITLPWRALAAFLGSIAAVLVVVIAMIFALGTTPFELWDNVVIQPTRLRLVWSAALGQPSAAIYIAIAGFAAAWVVRSSKLAGRDPQTPWPGIARLVVALLMWGAILTNEGFGLDKSGRIIVPLALAWVALLPVGGWKDGKGAFTRTALVFFATLQVMQIYPVAGTQIEVAALLFVPIGALILSDAVTALRVAPAWSFGRIDSRRVVSLIPSGLAVLLVVFFIAAIAAPLRTWAGTYRDNDPLGLPTAGGLRLPPDQATGYRAIAGAVKQNCTSMITIPGFTSMYLFTGIEPPDAFNSSDWVYLLADNEQSHTVAQVRDKQDLCLVVNYSSLAVWSLTTRLGKIPRLSMAKFIDENRWEPIAIVGKNRNLALYKRLPPGQPGVEVLKGY